MISNRIYEYFLDDAKILEFLKMLKYNRGKALAYLKREEKYEKRMKGEYYG
jgi:hypothetical protein